MRKRSSSYIFFSRLTTFNHDAATFFCHEAVRLISSRFVSACLAPRPPSLFYLLTSVPWQVARTTASVATYMLYYIYIKLNLANFVRIYREK